MIDCIESYYNFLFFFFNIEAVRMKWRKFMDCYRINSMKKKNI